METIVATTCKKHLLYHVRRSPSELWIKIVDMEDLDNALHYFGLGDIDFQRIAVTEERMRGNQSSSYA